MPILCFLALDFSEVRLILYESLLDKYSVLFSGRVDDNLVYLNQVLLEDSSGMSIFNLSVVA